MKQDLNASQLRHAFSDDKGNKDSNNGDILMMNDNIILLKQLNFATHCNTLQNTAKHCNPRQHVANRGNAQQHTATRSNTLQGCV